MKKILVCLLIAVVLSNCEVRVKEANAQIGNRVTESEYFVIPKTNNAGYYINRITVDSMEFAVFVSHGSSNMGNTTVINLTKERLEIEVLKKQLNK